MRTSARHRARPALTGRGPDVSEALQALSTEELRSFISDALGRLDDGARGQLEDALLRRATSAGTGWRPTGPTKQIVDEVRGFVGAARRIGQADPSEVDAYLRQGVTASLAGDQEGARAILEALLLPVANVDIDLGQHELVDEVLSVDLNDCVARYVAAVYATAPISNRADEVFTAIESTHGLTYWTDPLQAVERALGDSLPDREQFLPLWIARIERDLRPAGDWESDQERWLREAITRRDGLAGLERIARATKRPEAVSAWCRAVVAHGDWAKSLAVYEDAAELVPPAAWRGDFLDGAALAAQVLERKDRTKKLEAAWLGAPSLMRLVRWLLGDAPSSVTLKRRAATALATGPTKSPRLLGLLHILVGDIAAAATLLKKAPGLGWSSGDHPGHLLFPAFAWLFGGTPGGSVCEGLAEVLHRPAASEHEYEVAEVGHGSDAASKPPQLAKPSVVDALQRADVTANLTVEDRSAALAALKTAATKRADGVLSEKRRRHYGHAALLVACCVELEDGSGKGLGSSTWVEALRARTSHFPAFQRELRAALARARR